MTRGGWRFHAALVFGIKEPQVPPLRYASVLMNNRTLDRLKALKGFARLFRPTLAGANMGHPSSARWPVPFIPLLTAAGKSFPRHDKGRAALPCGIGFWERQSCGCLSRYASVLMNNRTLDRRKALEGLRPSFSAHVRWREHGAPVKCAAARTVQSTLNLPEASRLLGMTRGGRRFHAALVCGVERAAGPSNF